MLLMRAESTERRIKTSRRGPPRRVQPSEPSMQRPSVSLGCWGGSNMHAWTAGFAYGTSVDALLFALPSIFPSTDS